MVYDNTVDYSMVYCSIPSEPSGDFFNFLVSFFRQYEEFRTFYSSVALVVGEQSYYGVPNGGPSTGAP